MVKRVDEIEAEIEKIETEITQMDKTLSEPDHLSPPDEGFFHRYIDLKKSLNDKWCYGENIHLSLRNSKKLMNNGFAAI